MITISKIQNTLNHAAELLLDGTMFSQELVEWHSPCRRQDRGSKLGGWETEFIRENSSIGPSITAIFSSAARTTRRSMSDT